MQKTEKNLRHVAMVVAAGALAVAGTMTATGTAAADTVVNPDLAPRITVDAPVTLLQGQYFDTGYTRLILQTDGNLVVYKTSNRYEAKWSAPGSLGCGARATLQTDGNFVVYGGDNRICWASNSFTPPGGRATLEVWGFGGVKVDYTSNARSLSYAVISSTDPY
ncbi:hypothetical protein ACFC1T_16660 [Kitasatospora sp. NPDC056076]|uniref:hypothetical protein n=1 Tax=Kitasatospora sp. NPDC056076 TaxID=3345703 RepID=UPI0035E2BB57